MWRKTIFIIIPLIILFISIAYLQVNPDISFIAELTIYFIIIATIFISWYLARVVQKDMKKQELNLTITEINRLKQKLKVATSDMEKLGYKNEIERLIKEYDKEVLNV